MFNLYKNNGDNTLTLTNTVSGAVTTIDTAVESVVLDDGISINFNGDVITVDDADKKQGNFDLTGFSNTELVLNTYDKLKTYLLNTLLLVNQHFQTVQDDVVLLLIDLVFYYTH